MKLQQNDSNNQPHTTARSWWHPSLCYLLILTLVMPSLPSYAVPANNALPSGGNISAGSGTINSQGNNMTINQTSDKLAINWSSYNIGANASVTYVQPNAQAVALNRIFSADPSQIYGRLNANGQVILINPNGVVIGPGAKINVGAMIVSTMNLSDSDFLSNNYRFTTPSVDTLNVALPQILNRGAITSAGGYVHLIGHNIRNEGTINAPGGTVGLLAGNTVSLALSNNGNLLPLDITNTINGNATINHSGLISTANSQGVAGNITILGDQINLAAGSMIDASGTRGGGHVLIKSTLRDKSDPLYNTSKLYFDKQATINANATTQGNGGYVDTSANNIQINGAVSVLGAQGGNAGTWLLDPGNVYICSIAVGGTCAGQTDSFAQNFNAAAQSYVDINSLANALAAGNNVTISTGGADSTGSVGHLYLNELLNPVMTKRATLTLIAGIDITLNANINATGCSGCGLNLIFDATNGKGAGSGAIVVKSNTLNTNGGAINFKSGTAFSNAIAQNVITSGGDVHFEGDVLIANPKGVNIDATNGNPIAGNVKFDGRVDSSNRYDFIAFTDAQKNANKVSWNDARGYALNGNTEGVNNAIGGSYLATIGSQLQNTLAGTASCNSAYGCFAGAWLGGHLYAKVNADGNLVDKNGNPIANNNTGYVDPNNNAITDQGQWQWADGPLAGQTFFNANLGAQTGGTKVCNPQCAYTNWGNGEPNHTVYPNTHNNSESALQFFGSGGLWNDLNQAKPAATSGDYQVLGYVQESTLAASSLNIKANSVTFSGAVGNIKPLSTLTISAPTININGGLVRTTGAQTYESGSANRATINLGAANTKLQVISQVLPNGYQGCVTVGGCLTGGTLSLNNSNINATQNSSLTLHAFSDVTLGANQSINANSHMLNVTIEAGDSALNNNAPQNMGGTINLNAGSHITTDGNVTLIADSMNFSNPTTPTIVGNGTLNLLTRTASKNIYLGTAGDGLSIASSVFSGPNRAFSPSLATINVGKPINNGSYQQSGTVTLNNFTYDNPLTVNTSGNIVLNNTVQTTSGAALTLNNATTTNTSSSISGSGSLSGGQLITVNSDGTGTYSGTITGTSTALTKTGKGTLTLTGANTYTGATNVNQGTLVAGANAFGSEATKLTAITVANGATFKNDPGVNASNTIASLSGVAGSRTLLNSGTLATGGDNANTTFAGILSGTGNLTKIGSGTFTLSSANDYSGITTINKGTLANGINNALLSTAIVRIADGGTYDLNNFDQTLAELNDANPNPNGGAQLQLGNGNLTVGNSNHSLFSGVISGSGNLTKTGSGNLTLSGKNNYTGTTRINSGTVVANNAYALGGTTTNGVIINNGGTLLLNNLTLTSGANNSTAVSAVTLNGGTLNSVGTAGLTGSLQINQTTQINNLGLSLANQVPGNCTASNCSLALSALNIASGQTLTLGNGSLWTLSTGVVSAKGANLAVNTRSTYTANDTIGTTGNALTSINVAANGTTLQNVVANQINVMDGSRRGVVLNGTLDASGSANGTVTVEAQNGSIRVNDNIKAGATSGHAITLKAGSNYAAGDAAGGDVILGNNAIFQTNGKVLIYTGSIARSGATTAGFTLAANNPTYYYGKDTGYTPSAAYSIVFREQPTASLLTLTFKDPKATYNAQDLPGFGSGDVNTLSQNINNYIVSCVTQSYCPSNLALTGSLGFALHGQSATPRNAGVYDVLQNTLADNNGALFTVKGNYTINQASINVIGLQLANKTYDGTTIATVLNPGNLIGVYAQDQAYVRLNGQLIDGFADKHVNYVNGQVAPKDMSSLSLAASGNLIGSQSGNYRIANVTLANAPTITPAKLTLTPVAETVDYGIAPTNPINIALQGRANSNSDYPVLFGNDTISNLHAEFKDFASIRKLGNNCCTLTVASGYVINDGNNGRNYVVVQNTAAGSIRPKLPGVTTGDASTSSLPNGSLKSVSPWTNGRVVSGENKYGALAKTADTMQWNVTDTKSQKRIQLACSIFGQVGNEEVCGRQLSQKSALAITKSYQSPKIEFDLLSFDKK